MKDETRDIEVKQLAQQASEEKARQRSQAEAEAKKRQAALEEAKPKAEEAENEYTKIVDYQPVPESDDSVRGIYSAFQAAQKPKPVYKPPPPAPKIMSRQERIFNKVQSEMKRGKIGEVDPDDIQMDRGDFDGTVNSNVDDYADFLAAKAQFGDKGSASEKSQKEEVVESQPQP